MIDKEEVIEKLKKLVAQNEKMYDSEPIDRAIALACRAHDGQHRSSGEEYVCHPLEVACILVEMGMDSETIIAAILHDTIEDTDVEQEQIRKEFGENVAALVDGVTKITQMPYYSKEEQQAESVRKMLLAMSKDIRVIIIKLADRLHNMRTSYGWEPQKRRDKARETMDIYAPLAHRLGIRAVKEELEDLSLRILDPIAYEEIENNLALHESERNVFLQNIEGRISARLNEFGIANSFLTGRIKSIAGIYRKMYMHGKTFDQIYDIYAVRVIVDTVNDCYNVLGIVHDMFRPIPNRFKDYISTPKSNMYQSLHTTVIGKEKIPFEVQIRTWDMHYTAEYGIAAHWKYKLGIQKKDAKFEERLAWVRQFIESQKDVENAEDIVRSIKTDLSSDDVFALTPKGTVISLPVGSTVIDFAYAIHTAVGNRMVGAKVDGRIVPLDYIIKTGEIVEILTTSSENHGPSRDWLNIVKTGEARNKIRSWFKKERREENIEQGRDDIEHELSRNNIRLPEEEMQEFLLMQAKKQHCESLEDFYAAIGYGGIILSRIIPRIKEDFLKLVKTEVPPEEISTATHRHNNGGVIINGMDNCLVKFARCCHPVPGDDIIGFVTRGFGVSIHKKDCVNVPKNIADSSEPERWVQVYWEDAIREEFKASLRVRAVDRIQLLVDITSQLAALHIMIFALNVKEPKDGQACVDVTIGVNGVAHLQSVIERLKKISGVSAVERRVL